jgi:CDP-diacylglycerol---glycerol-3-phosphate 3-phosphatidyltransferase
VPLLKDFPDRCHVSLFRSPKLKGVLSNLIPPRFNEGFGTWHAKIYGADDNVMISGSLAFLARSIGADLLSSANLNKSYFTDRQDRYILFSSAPELSSYCFDFLKTASSFSYKLLPSPIPGNTQPVLHWPHSSSSHPHHIESHAGLALFNFQRHYNAKSGNIQERLQRENSVVIFPVIQAGQFNIREEEECLRQLFYHLEAVDSRRVTQSFHPLLSLTTGYFGLFKSYKDLILRSHVPTHIICSSPKVHVYFLSSMTNNSSSSSLGERFLWFQRNI